MTCFSPLEAAQQKKGERPLIYKKGRRPKTLASGWQPLELPCGQCIGCRLEHSRQWALRCVHEASQWDDNCFITLTYDEDNKPWDGSLNKKHFQKFMKRLRWANQGKKIKYFHCGEYGEKLQRPHYHALIFNHDWEDKELWSVREGLRTYTSEKLQQLWRLGFATTAELNWQTAAYTARYALKKITGHKAEEHYTKILDDLSTTNIQTEYTTMSLRPPIGKEWFSTYSGDCYPSDYISHQGKKLRVPRYYDKQYEIQHPEDMERVKEKRKIRAAEHEADQTPARLLQRERCTAAKIKALKRNMED